LGTPRTSFRFLLWNFVSQPPRAALIRRVFSFGRRGRHRMPARQLDSVARHVRKLAGALADKDTTDAELLRRFTAQRDAAAFAALVERHGGLVWSVCRRVLQRTEDVEDAFQATFLILIRKAKSVRKQGALASWLYGVAYRTAMRARQSAERRRQPAPSSNAREAEQPVAGAALRELQALLDHEVQRLPEKYRAPFVLCCLQGKSRAEAAQELGWKEGTVGGRVAQARDLLRQRLTRRGVELSAALCATALVPETPAAAVPAAWIAAATGAALRFRAGSGALGSPTAMALARGVLRSMFATRFALGATLVLAAGLVTAPGAPRGRTRHCSAGTRSR
jgi:RNA polymerase sigma factor (sigma-70 family)